MSDRNSEESVYRVTLWRRLAYPGIAVACAGFSLYHYTSSSGGDFPEVLYLVAAGSVLLFLYVNSIRLEISRERITLRWPLVEPRSIEWDEIVQIRRAAGPPGRNFFIDLIVSPERSLQFNPFMFENSWDIIEKLNKNLDSDLFREDGLPEAPGEVAVAVDPEPDSGPNWILWAMALIVLLLFALLLIR